MMLTPASREWADERCKNPDRIEFERPFYSKRAKVLLGIYSARHLIFRNDDRQFFSGPADCEKTGIERPLRQSGHPAAKGKLPAAPAAGRAYIWCDGLNKSYVACLGLAARPF